MIASLSAVARRLIFVRETQGPNHGAWVEMLQRRMGGKAGDSWCADFVSFCLEVAYYGHSPIRQSGSTVTMLNDAIAKGFVVTTPQPDDLYFFTNDQGQPHHVGIVTDIAPVTGIAGNTSADGASSNGTGVFEHVLKVNTDRIIFVRLPKA